MASDDPGIAKILEEIERLRAEVQALRESVEAIRSGNCEPPKGRSTDLKW